MQVVPKASSMLAFKANENVFFLVFLVEKRVRGFFQSFGEGCLSQHEEKCRGCGDEEEVSESGTITRSYTARMAVDSKLAIDVSFPRINVYCIKVQTKRTSRHYQSQSFFRGTKREFSSSCVPYHSGHTLSSLTAYCGRPFIRGIW